MIDYGGQKTDLAIRRAEWRLSRVYNQAAREIDEKTKAWQERHEAKDKKLRQMVKDGKMSKADYQAWQRGQVFQGKQWEGRKEQIRQVLLNSDKAAMNVIKEGKLGVFASNANYIGYGLERDSKLNTGFLLYDEATVARLIKSDPKMLPMLPPEKAVLKDKAYTYYNKLIAGAITQGIIQGEDIGQIAHRIARTTGEKCYKSAVTNARTAYTGAQNAGRIEGMHQAQRLGIKMQKQWLATPDDRTRAAHADLDGQVQNVDDPFESELGHIDYPGDPNADPANVYNCRCSLLYVYPEYPSDMKASADDVEDMSLDEWEEKKAEEPKGESPTKEELLRAEIESKMQHEGFFPEEMPESCRKAIIESIKNCDNPQALDIIGRTIDNVSIHHSTEKCCYKPGTGEIYVKHEDKDDFAVAQIFWHEYGHFLDDVNSSNSGLGDVRGNITIPYFNAKVKEQCRNAAVEDLNAFLKRYGIDGDYSFAKREFGAYRPQLYDGNGKLIDPRTTMTDDLPSALTKWVKEITGANRAEQYLYEMGYPKEVDYFDYYKQYTTPIRKEIKFKPKYKGAEDDYIKAVMAHEDALDKFRNTHDMAALEAEQTRLMNEADARQKKIGAITDTFDEAAGGSFLSAAVYGGHSVDYYSAYSGPEESVANVFSSFVRNDEFEVKAFKDLCPNLYDAITGGFV